MCINIRTGRKIRVQMKSTNYYFPSLHSEVEVAKKISAYLYAVQQDVIKNCQHIQHETVLST